MKYDRSIIHADEEISHYAQYAKFFREDVREELLAIIRLSLIESYRKGWKDAEKYFGEDSY